MRNLKTLRNHLNRLSATSAKSVLIIAALISFTYTQAATSETNPDTSKEVATLNKSDIIKIYDWTVKTNAGTFSGTSPSLQHAYKMVKLVSAKHHVEMKSIETLYVLKNEANSRSERNYFWEVKTNRTYAKGYSSTKAHAKKMIEMIAPNGVVSTKIIFSQER